MCLIATFFNPSPASLSFTQLLKPAFLLFFLVYAALFYLNAYVLIPQLYLAKKYGLYLLVTLLLLAAIVWLKPYDRLMRLHLPRFDEERMPPFDRVREPGERAFLHRPRGREVLVDITSIVLFVTVWSVSMAMQIIRQWRQTERRALQAEADKVNAELSFLKAQINPHFLFNTLNNIYSLAIIKNEQTPNAILKLSEILHYITDDVRNDFVPLQSEVDCVKNYIELQKLRLTDKVTVQLVIQGRIEAKQIAPLLLMTFIENAFKYGISSHEPCAVTIEIRVADSAIEFFCRNKVMVKNTDEERVGVGIRNAQKRLDYLYPGKYLLNIHTADDAFSVHLTIQT